MKNIVTINYCPANLKKIGPDAHPYWEFVCYIKGTGMLTVGDQQYPFEPGDIICQPPFIPHSEVSEKGFQNIYLTIEEYYYEKNEVHRLKDNDQKDILTILNMLYRVYHHKNPNWQAMAQNLLNLFELHLISHRNNKKNIYVSQLEDVLIANLGNCRFDIRKVMENYPICSDHLRRLFKKENGQSPSEYLLERRMAYARELLGKNYSSTPSIKYIASLVGFDDPYYFSKVFKKNNGISPSQWTLLS